MDHITYDYNIVKEKVYKNEVNCEVEVNPSISVAETEVDITSDDIENNSKQLSFKCDGGVYETTVNVAITMKLSLTKQHS